MGIESRITGTVLEAKTSSFKADDGVEQTYGKIQILTADLSGDFFAITNLKVRKENFGWIPDISALKGKKVTLDLDQNTYQNKVSYYLSKPVKH